ncbi:hypothetical protein [Spirulina major]|uniref:hypothetical protein n=1 Tax=Spirulina major TaxID=270636 RepID=UPI001114EE6B|nr:hypothetical protein [Spirulina major]
MNLFFWINSIFLLSQSTAESALACKPIGTAELILIVSLLAGLFTLIATAAPGAITLGTGGLFAKMALPGVLAKIIASLGVGASMTQIIIPLKGFLEIAAVVKVVDAIKAILECYSP